MGGLFEFDDEWAHRGFVDVIGSFNIAMDLD